MLDEYKEHYARQNTDKDNILYDFVSVEFLERQNYTAADQCLLRSVSGGVELAIKGHEKAFQVLENVLVFCVWWWIHDYFVENH